jgi:hypothetical protein
MLSLSKHEPIVAAEAISSFDRLGMRSRGLTDSSRADVRDQYREPAPAGETLRKQNRFQMPRASIRRSCALPDDAETLISSA